jgi:hypothetical protein
MCSCSWLNKGDRIPDVTVTVELCDRSVEPFVQELGVVQSAKVRSYLVLKESSLGGWVQKLSLRTI